MMGWLSVRDQIIVTWCFLMISCWIETDHGAPIPNLDDDEPLEKLKRNQAEFVPVARVPPHPWQMLPSPHRNHRNHLNFLNKPEETSDDLFYRPKRRGGGSQHLFARLPTEQQADPDSSGDVAPDELLTSTPSAPAERDEIDSTETPGLVRARTTERGVGLHRFKKTNAPDVSDRERLMNKFWSSVYSPLPYGGPRALLRDDEAGSGYKAHQASSLPVARTAHREKEKERAELRLPIPDSEIPSPGHYRQPINHTLLHSSKTVRSGRRKQSSKTELQPSSTVNVEAFKILMEVIKSLREVSLLVPPSTITPQPSFTIDETTSAVTETPAEMDGS